MSSLKLRTLVRFPAQVLAGVGLAVAKANGIYTFALDYTGLANLPTFDPTSKVVAVYDTVTLAWNAISVGSLLNGAQTTQTVTAAGAVTVANGDGLVVLNKTVGAATTVNLPAATSKIGPVKVVDWKGDAGTNAITLTPNGSEKINGLSTWVLSADNASALLTPIPGVGYAL